LARGYNLGSLRGSSWGEKEEGDPIAGPPFFYSSSRILAKPCSMNATTCEETDLRSLEATALRVS